MQVQKKEFTTGALISLAVPIVLEAVLMIITGMIDSVMVSSAGTAAVSGIALVDPLMVLVAVSFYAIAAGGAAVTSQYIGSRDMEKAKTSARQLLYLTLFVILSICFVIFWFVPQILKLVYGVIEQAVFENAKAYFYFCLPGLPFLATATVCTALMRCMGKSKLAFYLAIGASLVNIAGNAVLIYGFELGAAGAAIATTFSRAVWAVVTMIILHDKKLPVYFEKLLRFELDFSIMGRVMKIGAANGLESGLFEVGRVLVGRLVASFGTVFIAAQYVASTICNIGWNMVCSLGTVLLFVVGQCIGAGKPEQAKSYSKKMIVIGNIMVLVYFGLVFLLRQPLASLFDFEQETLSVAGRFTGLGALVAIVTFYGCAFVPVSAFRAAGDVKYSVTLAIFSMFAFRVGLSYLLNALLDLGLYSVWIGMGVDWIFRSVHNIIHFHRGKWLTKKLI